MLLPVGLGPKVEACTVFKSDALILLQFVGRLAAGGSGGYVLLSLS